jgi:EmrB/QacA subfamily drug resistance transporter
VIEKRQRNVGFLVAGCFFMEILDSTIVSTSAPRIGAALHVPSTSIGLLITAYLITVAVIIPLSGWMVSRFGTRKVFLSAIAIFTVASLLCATSVSFGELVAMRVLQGIGGAMMVPVGRLTVLSGTAKADLMRLISYIVWPGLVAPVIAPLAGAFITTYASWRWLFTINVPLGAVAFLVAVRLVPHLPRSVTPRLDWVGVALTCTGLGGLTYAASQVSEPTIPWSATGIIASISLVIIAGTAWHLLRAPNPLIDLRALHIKALRTSLEGGSLSGMATNAMPFLVPLLFENAFGWSAVKAGGIVMVLFIGNIGIKPANRALLNRFGFRTVLTAANLGLAATAVCAGLLTRGTPVALIIIVLLVSGVTRSINGTSYNTLSFSDVPQAEMAHANSLASTVQQLSAGYGVAIATIGVRAGISFRALLGHSTTFTSYTFAFFIIAVLPLVGAVQASRLGPDVGDAARTISTSAAPG